MFVSRIFSAALAALAIAGPVWATGDPLAVAVDANTPAVAVKGPETTALNCDPSGALACPPMGDTATVAPTSNVPVTKPLPVENTQ
ncbi:hypothetical protein [Gymnodinialimonas sp.]